MVHHLKTLPKYFTVVNEFRKSFEVRLNDRDYKEHDTVVLYEYTVQSGFTGRAIKARIGYCLYRTCREKEYAIFGLLEPVRMPFPALPPKTFNEVFTQNQKQS